MNQARPEKRREARRVATGEVSISFADPAPCEIRGQLIDLSTSGFRVRHAFRSLMAGQVVEYSHPIGAGKARVIWNRIHEQTIETGFLVL